MVWHVHYKEGKYQIWSTIVDAYILTHWVDKNIILEAYAERARADALVIAHANIDRAKEHWCSATPPFRCDLSELCANNE